MVLPVWFKILLGVFLFFLGASVYSFLNVVIFRVPRGEEFVKTRSHCPGCGKLLSPLELVPVVSYVCLGGKCKICGSKIGLRDVSIEIFGGLSAIASFWLPFLKPTESMALRALGEFYANVLAGLTVFAFIGALTVITFIQIDMGVVKVGTLIALAIPAAAGFFTLPEIEMTDRLIAAAAAGIIMAILYLLFRKAAPFGLAVTMAIAGAFLGVGRTLLVAVPVAITVAILEWIVLLLSGKKPIGNHFKIAFAMSVGVVTAILAGEWILEVMGMS